MEDAQFSGMMPLLLSGSPGPSGSLGLPFPGRTEHPSRRILTAYSGSSLSLSGASRKMAFGFGRKNARTTIFRIPENRAPERTKDPAGFDGVFIGIAPDGTGSTQRAVSFIRTHIESFARIPVAIFFLLHQTPDLDAGETGFRDLSRICPLDVRSFVRTDPCVSDAVARWAGRNVWPLMETAWLADLVFPEPADDRADSRDPEPARPLAVLE